MHRRVTGDYGGRGVNSEGDKRFFYLVVNGDAGLESVGSVDQQAFFRSGINSGQDYVFIFIDIASDKRLANDLMKRSGGQEFYWRIEQVCPTFLITQKLIKEIRNLELIELYPIKDYTKDVSILYEKMGLHQPGTRKRFIKFLRRLNAYGHLKPNIFGLGFNANEIIDDLIDKLERAQP